jgi:hypothetical protein
MLRSAETDSSKYGLNNFGVEIQAAARAELDLMLKTPMFAQSNRCKSFLSYVVFETLAGHASQLKERTIGINVFGRANDYDTGETSIVRVTANEVCKRIDQYYRESETVHSIQIELPRGSYVPEFKVQPLRRRSAAEEPEILNDSSDQVITSVDIPEPQVPDHTHPAALNLGTRVEHTSEVPPPPSRRPDRKPLVYFAALILVLAFAAAILGVWGFRAPNRTGPQVWEAFSHSNVPVLLCIDAHDLHLPNEASSPDGQSFVDLVLHRQIISLDDAAVLSSIAAVLGKKGIPFRVVGAAQTSLTEFRRQPVILIGAIDNKWTIRLTQNLRYRIKVANTPGSGSNKQPVASIVDSEYPKNTAWTVDLSVPYGAWKSDYAIVARMDDSTTGVPVLIEAGLGNDGSLAASELIASGALVPALANEPLCKSKSNFEAVIKTDIIDTRPGPPHILRINCW